MKSPILFPSAFQRAALVSHCKLDSHAGRQDERFDSPQPTGVVDLDEKNGKCDRCENEGARKVLGCDLALQWDRVGNVGPLYNVDFSLGHLLSLDFLTL
jgi:hypothetical protein